MLHFGISLAAISVLVDVELGKLVHQKLRQSEQLRYQWRIGVGMPNVDDVVRFWLGIPSWSKFSVFQKLVQVMLVLATSG